MSKLEPFHLVTDLKQGTAMKLLRHCESLFAMAGIEEPYPSACVPSKTNNQRRTEIVVINMELALVAGIALDSSEFEVGMNFAHPAYKALKQRKVSFRMSGETRTRGVVKVYSERHRWNTICAIRLYIGTCTAFGQATDRSNWRA